MKKNFKYILGGLVLLVLLAGAGYLVKVKTTPSYVEYKDPSLTSEEISKIDQDIAVLESKLTDLKKSDNKDEIFKHQLKLADSYRLRGKYKEAKQVLLDSSKLFPENPNPWEGLFVVDELRTDYEAAELDLQQAIKINSSNPQYWRWYYELASGPLKFTSEQMKGMFQEALKQTNGNADVFVLYANYLESQNDLVGAVANWKKAIEVDPGKTAYYQEQITRIQAKLK